MDQPEAANKNIRKIINDITESMNMKKELLKKSINNLKENHSKQMRESVDEHTKTYSLFEEINRENQTLNTRKSLIKKSLEKEEIELAKVEKENIEFLNQMNELEAMNKSLNERKLELNEKFKNLQIKSSNLKDRLLIRTKSQKNQNEAYKKYLGLEIVKLRENVIKIQFNNFSSDFYCIFDFGIEDCVSECCPEMNIERLNYIFKEKSSFYEFIKYLRDSFKQKM